METTETVPITTAAIVRKPALSPGRLPTVEIAVPVYNEQVILRQSIERLHAFLCEGFPFDWKILIVNNGSIDGTAAVAESLTRSLTNVEFLNLSEKGRGRALRAAWLASSADIVCYMDVDLSTDLKALLPLVAPLVSGHSAISIGSRLSPTSQVTRGALREFVSRAYNLILRIGLRAKFRDAQCGFKACRGDVARELIPQIEDNCWFFDTELLVLAQRRGMPIYEVPVTWTDDPDSRVKIVSTAIDDLRGVARLARSDTVYRFIAVGALSTAAYALLYLMFRELFGPGPSNAIALAITAVGNTALNRSFTFDVRGRDNLIRHVVMGTGVFFATLLITSVALFILNAVHPDPRRWLEVVVLVASSVIATIVRYVTFRFWIFAHEKSDSIHAHPFPPVEFTTPQLRVEPATASRDN